MIENSLARKVLVKASPEYAKKRVGAILWAFLRETVSNPQKYLATIASAPLDQQANLIRMLKLNQEFAKLHDLDVPPPEPLGNELTELAAVTDSGILVRAFFEDKPGLDQEYMTACQVISAAGLLT